ncbi:MAG: hypothetical protein ABI453_14960 [Isosphaeraceae bacterium]
MTPPPIRYPLPTLVLAALATLLLWKGAEWSRPWRAQLSTRWQKTLEGPPVPESTEPQIIAGPIVRRALLLRDGVPWSNRPGGPDEGTIRLRQFADVYDVWPLEGPPTHYRIGNRGPIGWVAAADLLPWNTRLVIRPPDATLRLADQPGGSTSPTALAVDVPLPIVSWNADAVQVAVWDRDAPWSTISRFGWVPIADLPQAAWQVWLSQNELRALAVDRPLRDQGEPPDEVRLRAVLGRLTDVRPLIPADVKAALAALPPRVFQKGDDAPRTEERLQNYEQWTPDAAWSGFSFRALPLDFLP